MTAARFQSAETSTTRRVRSTRLRAVAVAASIGAAGIVLVGCSPDESPTNALGTTPSVVTGNQAPPGNITPEDGIGNSPKGTATADIVDAQGNPVGEATFAPAADGVKITVVVSKGITPGFHGVHIHSSGVCDGSGADPFTSAGGHLQVPGHTGHPSSGDLISINILPDGTGQMTTTTGAVRVDEVVGKSIIIHQDPDNFANIPTRYAPAPDEKTMTTGDAGKRVACGVIKAGE